MEDYIGIIAIVVACLGAGLVLLIGLLVIPAVYRKKHPEKYYTGPVYKVKLKSITPDISINTNLSREQNLINAKREDVAEVMVQRTSSENFYREIITGKLIPVATLRINGSVYDYYNYNNFIIVEWIYLYDKHGNIETDISVPFVKVSAEDLENYLYDRKEHFNGYSCFSKYLDSLFNNAESYYTKSLENVEENEDKKISDLLASIEKAKKAVSENPSIRKTSSSILVRSSLPRSERMSKNSVLTAGTALSTKPTSTANTTEFESLKDLVYSTNTESKTNSDSQQEAI